MGQRKGKGWVSPIVSCILERGNSIDKMTAGQVAANDLETRTSKTDYISSVPSSFTRMAANDSDEAEQAPSQYSEFVVPRTTILVLKKGERELSVLIDDSQSYKKRLLQRQVGSS